MTETMYQRHMNKHLIDLLASISDSLMDIKEELKEIKKEISLK